MTVPSFRKLPETLSSSIFGVQASNCAHNSSIDSVQTTLALPEFDAVSCPPKQLVTLSLRRLDGPGFISSKESPTTIHEITVNSCSFSDWTATARSLSLSIQLSRVSASILGQPHRIFGNTDSWSLTDSRPIFPGQSCGFSLSLRTSRSLISAMNGSKSISQGQHGAIKKTVRLLGERNTRRGLGRTLVIGLVLDRSSLQARHIRVALTTDDE